MRLKTKDYGLIAGAAGLSFVLLVLTQAISNSWVRAAAGTLIASGLVFLSLAVYRRLQKAVTRLQQRESQMGKELKKIHAYFVNEQKKSMDPGEERQKLLLFLNETFKVDASKIYQDYLESDFKRRWDLRKNELVEKKLTAGVSSNFDCETLYLLVRSARPEIAVEAGVRDGASTAHILQAMNENGTGRLFSIDLPNENHPTPKAFLVEETLKSRWELTMGDSRTELPKLLKRLDRIDLFFHDSKHTYDHMTFEYETAFRFFREGAGVLASHDVITPPYEKNAFVEFCKKNDFLYATFRNIGIGLQAPVLETGKVGG